MAAPATSGYRVTALAGPRQGRVYTYPDTASGRRAASRMVDRLDSEYGATCARRTYFVTGD